MTPRAGWKLFCTAIATAIVVVAVSFGPASTQTAPEPCKAPATTILLVRHADRAGKADSLSVVGVERSEELLRVASAAGITAIYHSDTRRTRDTAAPLAQALHIKLDEYPAKDSNALIQRILHDHAGETVLVVGHSNTIPSIIRAAGGPLIPDLEEFVYDGLYVLHVPRCDGPTRLTELKYGAPSH